MPNESIRMPKITEEELLDRAQEVIQGRVGDLSYQDLVKLLTVCSYVSDLVLVEIENRGQLTYYMNQPIVPDARPQDMWFETPISGPIAGNGLRGIQSHIKEGD